MIALSKSCTSGVVLLHSTCVQLTQDSKQKRRPAINCSYPFTLFYPYLCPYITLHTSWRKYVVLHPLESQANLLVPFTLHYCFTSVLLHVFCILLHTVLDWCILQWYNISFLHDGYKLLLFWQSSYILHACMS